MAFAFFATVVSHLKYTNKGIFKQTTVILTKMFGPLTKSETIRLVT
jgi:hypothetical protein